MWQKVKLIESTSMPDSLFYMLYDSGMLAKDSMYIHTVGQFVIEAKSDPDSYDTESVNNFKRLDQWLKDQDISNGEKIIIHHGKWC